MFVGVLYHYRPELPIILALEALVFTCGVYRGTQTKKVAASLSQRLVVVGPEEFASGLHHDEVLQARWKNCNDLVTSLFGDPSHVDAKIPYDGIIADDVGQALAVDRGRATLLRPHTLLLLVVTRVGNDETGQALCTSDYLNENLANVAAVVIVERSEGGKVLKADA
jgi:hypothetical protein